MSFLKKKVIEMPVDYTEQVASDLIKTKILENKPLMVARFGGTELFYLANYYKAHLDLYWYIKVQIKLLRNIFFKGGKYQRIFDKSGVFPPNQKTIAKFCELMMADMADVDILASWLPLEKIFEKKVYSSIKIDLKSLLPVYGYDEPWSLALAGKKVLVIHPFAESIKKQYCKRTLLFKTQKVLPEFDLQLIKAVQSLGNAVKEFKDWFAALDNMKRQIDKTNFDISLIGCGAYGFPLAAHIKRLGKQAIHMGGSTQILFGIKGRRWDNYPNLYNEHWVRPTAEERPSNYSNVEGGCYW